MNRPKGFLVVEKVLLTGGQEVSTQRAVDYGWIKPSRSQPGWDLQRHEIPLGPNLFVDGGRQLLAYCFGDRAPLTDYVCAQFGVGTGTTPPKVIDVGLETPLNFYGGSAVKPVDLIDFPTPFVARVQFTLAAGEANGYLLTEMGLFSGDDSLLARRVHAGINKSDDFAPVLSWRIRF